TDETFPSCFAWERPVCPRVYLDTLEDQFQRQLADSRIVRRANAAEAAVAHRIHLVILIRLLEIHAVEDVEELRAELKAPALPQRNVFKKSHVPGRLAGETKTAFAGVPELTERRQRERCGIDVIHARRRIPASPGTVRVIA